MHQEPVPAAVHVRDLDVALAVEEVLDAAEVRSELLVGEVVGGPIVGELGGDELAVLVQQRVLDVEVRALGDHVADGAGADIPFADD
jgi:hypothetical protein